MSLVVVSSYPRSGRHKLASMLTALQFDKGVIPCTAGFAEYSQKELGQLGWLSVPGVGNVQSPTEVDLLRCHWGWPDMPVVVFCGTHAPRRSLSSWSTPDILTVVRDPRAVVVSYARHWQKMIGESQQFYENLLHDMVLRDMRYCRERYPRKGEKLANLVELNWEDWHSDVKPSASVIQFENLQPSLLALALAVNFGVLCSAGGDPIPLETQRQKDPVMFRTGLVEGWRDEMPVELQMHASRRWGSLLKRFGYPLA